MQTIIQEIRDISTRFQTGLPLTEPQTSWLGRVLDDFLAHRHRSIEEAMGLRFPRGGIPWWRDEANRKRDAAILALAQRFMAGMSVTAQAREIHCLSIRYAASAWRHDRERPAMPSHYAGSAAEHLYRAFASGAPMPVGERTLRHILGR
jgi:hypothetical protein